MNKLDKQATIYRTVSKMRKSQMKKAEIVQYMEQHAPHLLWSVYRAERIKECCNVLRFEDYAEWKTRLIKANFCKYDKFCLACATRRSILKIQQFIDWIERSWLQDKYWYHIVLTVKHNKKQSLPELMDKLFLAREKMAQRVRNSKRTIHKDKSFFYQFDGMVSSVEVTYTEKSWRHPHIHMLVCSDHSVQIEMSKFLKTKANRDLQRERFDITGDSFCVAMRPVDVNKNHYDRSGIAEVFKYAVKFSTLDVPQLVHLIEVQKARQYRFYSTYWCFRKRNTVSKKNAGRTSEVHSITWSDESIFMYKICWWTIL